MARTIRELTTAIGRGDGEAFADFFRERFDAMYGEARRATGRDESFCLDVVQEAMLRVIRSMKPMDSERHLRAWLKRVVQSCAYDALRKEIRRAQREESAPARLAESAADHERLAWLRDELTADGGAQAALLVMRYRLGWTLQSIGEALGLRPGAVDGRLKRAVSGVRKRAREQFDE